jgi:hypothetical protein
MNRFERDFNDTDPITYRPFITAEQMQPKSHPGHEEQIWLALASKLARGLPPFSFILRFFSCYFRHHARDESTLAVGVSNSITPMSCG